VVPLDYQIVQYVHSGTMQRPTYISEARRQETRTILFLYARGILDPYGSDVEFERID